MDLSFDLQEEDLRLAQRAATKSLQKASAHWTTTAAGVLHWMCAGAFAMGVLDLVGRGSRIAVLVLGLAMVGSLYLVWVCQSRRMHGWQRMQMGPYPQPHVLALRESGLTIESARGTVRLPWSEVREPQSGSDHVFLLFGNGACFPVPARVLGTAVNRAEFAATVNTFRATVAAA